MEGSVGVEDKRAHFEFWKNHVEAWSSEGVSQVEYCRSNNLNISVFGYWKRKLVQDETPSKFVEVDLQKESVPSSDGAKIKLQLGDKFSIDVSDGFNSDTLRRVISIFSNLQ